MIGTEDFGCPYQGLDIFNPVVLGNAFANNSLGDSCWTLEVILFPQSFCKTKLN